jgi:hypothetical protein
MIPYILTADEAEMIVKLRSGDKKTVTQGIIAAIELYLSPLVDPVECDTPTPAPAPEPLPKWTPPPPPQHATWDDWTADDFERAHLHDRTHYNEEIAAFLVGRLAMDDQLTRSQLFGDMSDYLFESLRDGIDAAAGLIDSAHYDGIEALIEDAQRGRMHCPRKKKTTD